MQPDKLWRPTDPKFIRDPYPVYDQLRTFGPMFRASTGDYVVVSYDLCKRILQDKSCLSGNRAQWVHKMVPEAQKRGSDFNALLHTADGMLINMNPPVHTEVRALLSKYWPGKDKITALTNTLLMDILDELPNEFDVVHQLSKRLPALVISDILGIRKEEALKHLQAGFDIVHLLDPYLTFKDLERINSSANILDSFFSVIYQSDDMPEGLVRVLKSYYRNHPERKKESIGLLMFLFTAGFETTSALISMCLYLILMDSTIVARLVDSRMVENYVKEVLRLYSPVQCTGRICTSIIETSAGVIPEGSTLTLCIGAANRDPDHFYQAEGLLLDREKYDHLSFGYGIHHCLGHQMAIVEATTVVQHFLPQIRSWRLVMPPEWSTKYTIRSVKTMKVAKLK